MANEIITFPFDVTTDRIRFPQQTIDGKKGYYDIVEKKFISLNVLESLISNLKPEPFLCNMQSSFESGYPQLLLEDSV